MNLDEAIGQLENLIAEVRIASLTDDKTPLGSLLALRQEERAINEGRSAVEIIAFGDLNDFKQLNDVNGHDAGDTGINAVGESLKRIVVDQVNGKAYRQSGDEFVLLLNNSQFNRISFEDLNSVTFHHNEIPLRTSMSLGFVRNDQKTEFSELLRRAEVACQYAKTHGSKDPVQWTDEMKEHRLLRRSARCNECDIRIVCNIPSDKTLTLKMCPCYSQPLSPV